MEETVREKGRNEKRRKIVESDRLKGKKGRARRGRETNERWRK